MDPLYLQDPIKPAATPQAAKGLRDAINNDSPMMSGFVSGTYGYGGSSLLGLANLAEVVGADSVGQGLRKKATALFDTTQKFTPSAMSLDSVKDFGSGVDYVRANAGQGLGSMLPVIAGGAAGLAPGLAAATAPMYGENIGRLEQDPTLAGMSAGQKALYAAPTAAVQGALNYVVPGGFAAAAGRQIASRTGTGALGKAGVTLGTVGLVEGATEGGEELARQGMHALANPERDTSGDNKQLLESFVGGMVGGSPIGAVQAGAGYVQDRMAEREQDTRTLAQKAGDAIADAGDALGRRQGERDAAPANAALDAIQREAQERGVPPRDIINERIQRLNTPVDLSDAFTEAEATQRVMQDEEGKRATADELVQSILNDPDAAPEMRRAAEEHVAAVQAGATNKYEETGMKLGEAESKRAGVMGLVDTIAKAIEPVAGKPAPAKRGSAMTPNAPRYSDELYRHAKLYENAPDLRTLSINELSQLDRTIDRFAKGEFGPEVRRTLDTLFGSPEATETILDFYKPGASTVNTQQYDPDGGRTGADRTVAQEDESFSEATERDEENPLPTETKVEWGTGSFKLGENSYFDTKDAAQKERLAKTQSALGRDKPGASPKTAAIGMVDAEIERRGVEDAEAQRAVKLEITNQFFPQMDLMPERPANYNEMDRLARTDYDRRFQAFEKELNKRVRATNLRFQTVKATSEASKGGGLDYNDEDIKSLSLNMGKTGLNNPKTAHTRGVLIFERSDAQTPMITSAPMLLRRAFQIGADREQTGDEVGAMQNVSDLLDMSIASVLDYGARKTQAQQDYAERSVRGEVSVDEMMPDAPKMQFTGRIGYVKYGKPVYVDKLRDLPDDFKIMERNGRTYTMGDLKDALGRKNADVAEEATKTRIRLERMMKSGALNDFPKDVRARISQAISAHKKNPSNAVAAGAINALYNKHINVNIYDTPSDFERDDIVPSESETFTDESGAPIERGLLQYGNVGPDKKARIQRDADGFTSSNPAYNMTGRTQSGAPTQGSRGEDNMAPNTTALPENARALYKTESPAEWVVGVLAPRNGVEAAAKAWRTVKNATTDKMKKSRDLMARALHSISSMKPEDFRLTFNKELTAQQAQTMINRAKSVIDQEKVPDDRPGAVGQSAAEAGARRERVDNTKRSEQNTQTPGEATTDAKRTAELKAALAEVKRLLGKDFDAQVSNELFDPVSGAAWSGEFDPQQMRILIAAGATDTMGTGRHEALHALFKMLRDMGHPEAVKVIENLAKNPAVMSQLKKHLADHKNALEQLKDPEEAAAYAFQFWMAGQLKLGPQAKTFFQKVVAFLNKAQLALRDKVFGSEVAKDERARLKQAALALKLLGAFRDGAMASPEGRVSVQAVLEANKQALEARRLNTRAFGHKLHNFLKQGVYSAASVFEDSANPHVKALGKMFFRMEGDVRGEKQSFLEAAAQANDRYQVKVRNILVKLDKDTAELVSKYMNNRTELKDIHHPEAHAAVKDLRGLLDDLLLYQRNMNTSRWDAELMEWVPMGEVEKNYYPRVWSINVLTEKQGEFIEKMAKALEKYRRDFKGFPEIDEFNADTMAKAILNKLINGAGSNDIEEMTSDLGITPWQASVNKRDLNWLDDVAPGEFTEYFSDDVAEVMTSYISQATKRAEYNHAFGRGGEKIREGVYNAIVHEMGGEELAEKAASRLKLMRARIKAMSPDAIGAIISEEERRPNLVAAAREVLLEDRLEALNPDMKWTKEMIAQVRLGEYGFLKGSAVKAEDVAKVREGVDKIHADAVAKLEPVTKAIMAMEGTLGREIDPTLRHVMSGVTTFQNFRLLPLALFASINDVVGMVARGGTMKDSFQAFTRGIKEVGLMWKGEYSQDELAKLAERLGTVGGGNYLDAMGQTYSSQFMYGKLRRWNDALFKWNGLEAWNRAARIQATGVAIEFIKRHVEKPNEHSKRYLEELFGEGYDTSLIMKDGDLDYSNDRVQEAVLTWVNGAVLRPNASHRPIYASDPHYMLFYHLKQFAYSFHKVILRRAWIEAKEGNYTPAAALFTGYVPVSIAADVVKETLIMGDDDPWWTKGGLTAYLEHGIARANLGGVPQMWLGDIADPVMAFKDPGRYIGGLSNVAGPAPDQLIDLISVPFLEDKTLVKEAAGGVPGGVLIRRYVD